MSYLRLNGEGRFEIDGHVFARGELIDIIAGVVMRCGRVEKDVWISGRVELNWRGYYFANPAGPNFPLCEGMQARVPMGGSHDQEQG